MSAKFWTIMQWVQHARRSGERLGSSRHRQVTPVARHIVDGAHNDDENYDISRASIYYWSFNKALAKVTKVTGFFETLVLVTFVRLDRLPLTGLCGLSDFVLWGPLFASRTNGSASERSYSGFVLFKVTFLPKTMILWNFWMIRLPKPYCIPKHFGQYWVSSLSNFVQRLNSSIAVGSRNCNGVDSFSKLNTARL